jgi:hypothetical protein
MGKNLVSVTVYLEFNFGLFFNSYRIYLAFNSKCQYSRFIEEKENFIYALQHSKFFIGFYVFGSINNNINNN